MTKQARKAIGLRSQACSNWPVLIAPMALIPPQPGQGYPVINRHGHRTGPSSNPLIRRDASLNRRNEIAIRAIRPALVAITFPITLLFINFLTVFSKVQWVLGLCFASDSISISIKLMNICSNDSNARQA